MNKARELAEALEAARSLQKRCLDLGRGSAELGEVTKVLTALLAADEQAKRVRGVVWVSVADRLPPPMDASEDEGTQYLVRRVNRHGVPDYTVLRWQPDTGYERSWVPAPDPDWTVTHWAQFTRIDALTPQAEPAADYRDALAAAGRVLSIPGDSVAWDRDAALAAKGLLRALNELHTAWRNAKPAAQPEPSETDRYDMAIYPTGGGCGPEFRIYRTDDPTQDTVAMVYERAVADRMLAALNAAQPEGAAFFTTATGDILQVTSRRADGGVGVLFRNAGPVVFNEGDLEDSKPLYTRPAEVTVEQRKTAYAAYYIATGYQPTERGVDAAIESVLAALVKPS